MITRDLLWVWARKLYHKLTPAERMAHFVEPLAEILGLPPAAPKSDAWWAERKLNRDAAYQAALDAERNRGFIFSGEWAGYDWARIEYLGGNRGRWASVTPAPGPPPDPPSSAGSIYATYGTGTPSEFWRYQHSGVLSKLRMEDGTEINFGYKNSPRQVAVYDSIRFDYLGYLPGKPGRPRKPKKPPGKIGRPRKPDKLSRAELMRRLRARRKSEGP
jgi:hypothetical protein